MHIWDLINKFNWNKKAVISYFLIENNIEWLTEFISENITNTSLLEYSINEVIKSNIEIYYKIDNRLKITENNTNLITKLSLENKINLFNFSDLEEKETINNLLETDLSSWIIFSKIKNNKTLEYLTNNFLFKNSDISETLSFYDNLKDDKKDIIDVFFLKNTKKEIKKLPINNILKSIRNKEDTVYKGENKIINKLNSHLKEFKSSIYKDDYKNDISYQFLNHKSDFLESEIFILTDNENKEIYVNFINHNENLTSKVFENSWIQNKEKNKYLDKVEKELTKKIEEIDSWYKVITNSFTFKKWNEDINNNVFDIEWENDCILMMAIKISDNAKMEHDKTLWTLFDFLKEKRKNENNK